MFEFFLVQRLAFRGGVLAPDLHLPLLVRQMSSQLFFLLLQVVTALLQTRLQLVQGDLLGSDGGRLNPQRLAGVLRGLRNRRPGDSARLRHFEAELERPDIEDVAMPEPGDLGAIAVDVGAERAVQVAHLQAVGTGNEDAVYRRDAVHVQADVAAVMPAEERRRCA